MGKGAILVKRCKSGGGGERSSSPFPETWVRAWHICMCVHMWGSAKTWNGFLWNESLLCKKIILIVGFLRRGFVLQDDMSRQSVPQEFSFIIELGINRKKLIVRTTFAHNFNPVAHISLEILHCRNNHLFYLGNLLRPLRLRSRPQISWLFESMLVLLVYESKAPSVWDFCRTETEHSQ